MSGAAHKDDAGTVEADIEADPNAAAKMHALERERSAEWVAYLTRATSQRDRMLDREDTR